ncbi:MAG TPA: hypothetical protein DD473_27080 [Planctomycetaceae bacterium]|nr:hypothetical protein [Planctomycetaceae bacterium]
MYLSSSLNEKSRGCPGCEFDTQSINKPRSTEQGFGKSFRILKSIILLGLFFQRMKNLKNVWQPDPELVAYTKHLFLPIDWES